MRTVIIVFVGLMALANARMLGPIRLPEPLSSPVSQNLVYSSASIGIDSRPKNASLSAGFDPNKFKRHVFILSEICPIQTREMIFGDEIIIESQHPADTSYRTGVSCSTNFSRVNQDGGIIVSLVNSDTEDCNDYMKVNSVTDKPMIFCGQNKNQSGISIIYENDTLQVTWHTEVSDKKEVKNGHGVRILLTAYQNDCNVSQACFKCDSGLIIDQFHMCNGWNNCGDWSDEKYCPPIHIPTCPKSGHGHGWLITMSVLFVAAAFLAGLLAVMNYRLTRQQNGEPVASGAESRSFLPDFLRRMF